MVYAVIYYAYQAATSRVGRADTITSGVRPAVTATEVISNEDEVFIL